MEEYRTIGATFNDSLALIRSNFGQLFRAFLFIAGPAVLLYSVIAIWFEDRRLELDARLVDYAEGMAYDLPTIVSESFGITAATNGAVMLAQMLLIALAAMFVIGYDKNNGKHITYREVLNRLKAKIGHLLVVYVILLVIWLVMDLFFNAIVYGGAYLGSGYFYFGRFLYYLAYLFLYFPFVFIFAASYVALVKEDVTPLAAVKRGFSVIRGRWWWTWWIIGVAVVCFFGLELIFSSPEFMIQWMIVDLDIFGWGGLGEYDMLLRVTHFLGTFFSQLFDGFFYVLVVVHFYSLVERKEGTGLAKRIESIGTTADFYRGEEDY